MTYPITALNGGSVAVSDEDMDGLRGDTRGGVLLPDDAGYKEAGAIWNGMISRRPGLVVQPLGASDIKAAVEFAARHNLLISMRGGGHQIGGLAVAEGALLVDMSRMRHVHVDPEARTARVGAGCLLGDVDRECQRHGLAFPTGINSTTGIAGLTLGGGFGWITRKYGMTIDNLLSAEIVTADGAILTISPDSHPDLFWACKGGGGNFGVISSFEFRLHPVGPEILSGLLVHPLDAAPELLRKYREISNSAPDELTVWTVMRKAPPLPFIPEDWHGREVMIFAVCYCGDMAEGEKAVADLRALGQPLADVIGPHPYTGWQMAFDPLLTPGMRNYWKSQDFLDLTEETIGHLVDAARNLPDDQTEIVLPHLGGAMARVAPAATAFPQRKSHFTLNLHTRWEDPAKDAACIAWARALSDRVASQSAGSVYVNFMPEDDAARIGGAYGNNMDRLRQVKARYDPGNLFRVNHNISPATAARAAE
ncbi:FAD-binding oxidoreductase [Pontibaca salina]|uniref:FAD-binding oxidoreductase n=1 Tax=Pontibaca salina TaxID=2795731 RepID=A0A934HNV5_9RHOB|nr:FAD-binding oxidoreductase [Pontibaca salina]MBI6630451.1 FAD-binding oxidoreductase [Pontibaca salina]